MVDLLRSLEWANIGLCCPSCDRSKPDGHAPDCRLGRAIRELAEHPLRGFLLHDVKDGVAEYRGCAATSGMPAPVGTIAFTEPSPPEPTVGEMAREMGLDLDHGGFYGRMVNGEVVEAYAPKDIPPLYREHKAKRQPPPYAGIGPITQPTARQIAIAQAAKANSTGEVPPGYTDIILGSERPWPPTDPSALAEWLYARVVPGQTIVEYRWGDTMRRQAVVTEKGAAVDIDYVTIDILVGDGLFTIPGSPKVTRLLNPDGTVLWEAK